MHISHHNVSGAVDTSFVPAFKAAKKINALENEVNKLEKEIDALGDAVRRKDACDHVMHARIVRRIGRHPTQNESIGGHQPRYKQHSNTDRFSFF